MDILPIKMAYPMKGVSASGFFLLFTVKVEENAAFVKNN
jgi:hypothetical protein